MEESHLQILILQYESGGWTEESYLQILILQVQSESGGWSGGVLPPNFDPPI